MATCLVGQRDTDKGVAGEQEESFASVCAPVGLPMRGTVTKAMQVLIEVFSDLRYAEIGKANASQRTLARAVVVHRTS